MKYIGSKQKIAKYIVPIIQSYITDETSCYIEPFVGGANIIDKIKCKSKIGFDIDKLVIDLYNETVNHPELIESLPSHIDKGFYYFVRDNELEFPSWYRAAILLFGSYNARVYGGCYGASTTTKNGKFRNYYKEAMNNYWKQIPNLKDIRFIQRDFSKIGYVENAVIYCDPPYKKGIGYSKDFDHDYFWEWVREKAKSNIVLVSENEAPSDFECVWEQEILTHLNNRNKLKKVERLFILK